MKTVTLASLIGLFCGVATWIALLTLFPALAGDDIYYLSGLVFVGVSTLSAYLLKK